jgi:hypothetical protein
MIFQNVLSRPRDVEGRGFEGQVRDALHGVAGGREIGAKARLSGFGLTVELAAGGRGAEARRVSRPTPVTEMRNPCRARWGWSSR